MFLLPPQVVLATVSAVGLLPLQLPNAIACSSMQENVTGHRRGKVHLYENIIYSQLHTEDDEENFCFM